MADGGQKAGLFQRGGFRGLLGLGQRQGLVFSWVMSSQPPLNRTLPSGSRRVLARILNQVAPGAVAGSPAGRA
jgi:hypothetical protein